MTNLIFKKKNNKKIKFDWKIKFYKDILSYAGVPAKI